MALAHARKSDAAFFKETTAGTPTSDWATDGRPIRTTGPAPIDGLVKELLEDERSTTRPNERVGVMVEGLRGGAQQPLPCYLTGKDGTDATVVQTYLMDLLENVFGGINLGEGGTATGGSNTTVEMADTSAYEEGEIIGVVDTSASDGIVHPRRVTDNTANVITLDEALPFAVVSGDTVKGAATIYPDPDVLADSTGASGRTLSWHLRRGADSNARVEILGSVLQLELAGLGPGELLQALFTILPAYWYTPGDSDISSNPGAYSNSVQGAAPISMGPRTKGWFQTYGTTTQTAGIGISGLSINPGITRTKVPAVTSQADAMQAMVGWSFEGPISPTAEFVVTPHANTYNTNLLAGTYMAFRLARLGTEGNVVAIGMPRAQITGTPTTVENGNVLGSAVNIRGEEDTDSIGTTDIAKAPFYIALL